MSGPTVWYLLGRKAGDNTQVRALADELGCVPGTELVEKNILAQPWELLVHIGSGISLRGIDRRHSSELEPPWPELVISAGRRNEPVARWIRRASGGVTKLVHIGRPWAPLTSYDLIVTTPQYFLPRQSNILHNKLPLQRQLSHQLEQAAGNLRSQLAQLPRPWIAVLVGGDSGKFVFTAAKGARLGRLVNSLAEHNAGSLLVTDSARTDRATGDALQAQLQVAHRSHRWGSSQANPYLGFLALADAFVVTAESMSMVSEAYARNKPLYLFDMADEAGQPWWLRAHNYRHKPLGHRLAMNFGPPRMRREIDNMVRELVSDGAASWLDESSAVLPLATGLEEVDAGRNDELKAAALAVRQLLQ